MKSAKLLAAVLHSAPAKPHHSSRWTKLLLRRPTSRFHTCLAVVYLGLALTHCLQHIPHGGVTHADRLHPTAYDTGVSFLSDRSLGLCKKKEKALKYDVNN